VLSMANVNVTSDAWTEISITSGTVQNISATADIELSAEQTDNSGVVLKPSELYQWDNETIYARAVTEETGALRVVNFKKAAGGGGGYVLPVASSLTLGGVKVGSNLSIDENGVLSATGGGNPVGTIISFMGTSAPTNYLICDGTAYSISDYKKLSDHIAAQFGAVDFFGGDGVDTFAVPDLRGEFLRGSGANSHTNTILNVLEGGGGNVGEHQESTSFANANFSIGNNMFQGFGFSGYNGMNYPDNYILTRKYVTCKSSESGEYIEDLPATFTSRPTNTSVLYCIKYQ
jgi:hypothetical protein